MQLLQWNQFSLESEELIIVITSERCKNEQQLIW